MHYAGTVRCKTGLPLFNHFETLSSWATYGNTNWYKQCVLEGPQIRPDLANGVSPSAFTKVEIDKLDRYTSVDNWTKFTGNMYFPLVMLQTKCGRDGLDEADRQNMHSCSVAVRALLRIEQEADRYREEKKFKALSGKILVFSLSHDQKDVQVYGHYALVQGDIWTYYRYAIKTFNILTDEDDLLVAHNFVRNVLKTHVAKHIERLKDALAALPEPSGLSFVASSMSLNNEDSQQDALQPGDDTVFKKPGPSANAMLSEENAKMREEVEMQREQFELQREQMER